MSAISGRIRLVTAMVAISVTLSGCIAAVPVVMMAATAGAVAAAGFVVYKTAQTASGGQVRIDFNSADSKKATPPPPLPAGNAVYVYGGGARERALVGGLKSSGKFRTVAGGDSGAELSGLNSSEQENALGAACRGRQYDLVMAAVSLGESTQSNMLSFKKANTTERESLEVYDCRDRKVAWTQLMNVVNESRKEVPKAEIDTVAGQAWSERVLQAKG